MLSSYRTYYLYPIIVIFRTYNPATPTPWIFSSPIFTFLPRIVGIPTVMQTTCTDTPYSALPVSWPCMEIQYQISPTGEVLGAPLTPTARLERNWRTIVQTLIPTTWHHAQAPCSDLCAAQWWRGVRFQMSCRHPVWDQHIKYKGGCDWGERR